MFTGELMTCKFCKVEQQSHPGIESGWFKISAGILSEHVCPKCAGAPAPNCGACKRFYHERYGVKCPWCGHSHLERQSKGFGRQS